MRRSLNTGLLLFAVLCTFTNGYSLANVNAEVNSASASEWMLNDIIRQYPADQYRVINVGDSQAALFYSPASVTVARGIAHIIADQEQSGLNLQNAMLLAKQLNGKGWVTTISVVSLPLKIAPESASAPTESANSSTGDSQPNAASATSAMSSGAANQAPFQTNQQEIIDAHALAQQLQLLMTAITNNTLDTAGYRMVISEGMVAHSLLGSFANGALRAPDNFITLSPFWPVYTDNQKTAELIAQTPFPVLDVELENYSRWSDLSAPQRVISSKTQLKEHYRQRMFTFTQFIAPSATSHPFAQALGQEIYAWTTYLGW